MQKGCEKGTNERGKKKRPDKKQSAIENAESRPKNARDSNNAPFACWPFWSLH